MYFGLWITDKLLEGGMSLVRWVMFQFSTLFYQLIIFFYDIFIRLGTAEILTTSQVEKIYSRVTLLLGVFMLFKLSFSFVQYLINPETMSDKNKGAGKVITKAVIVVALLGFTPFIFRQAYNLQNALVESNVLGKIILGTSSANDDVSNFGSKLASYTFFSFYSFYDGEECEAADIEDMQDEVELNHSFELANDCLNEKGKSEKFAVYFPGLGLLCLAVGIFLLYIILSYCISVGMRTIQLAFLQLIAPIPILSYLGEDKDGAFSKWVKRCISTFIDLFIRIAIIYFVVYIINLLISDSDSYYWLLASTGNPTGRTKKWLIIVIILALLMFAKKAPELIKEILPQGIGSNIGFGFKDTNRLLGGFASKVGGVATRGGLALVGNTGAAISRGKKALSKYDAANGYTYAKRNGIYGKWDNKTGDLIESYSKKDKDKFAEYERNRAARNKIRNRAVRSGLGTVAAQTALGTVKGLGTPTKGNAFKNIGGAAKHQMGDNNRFRRAVDSGSTFSGRVGEHIANITGYEGKNTASYIESSLADFKDSQSNIKIDKAILDRIIAARKAIYTSAESDIETSTFSSAECIKAQNDYRLMKSISTNLASSGKINGTDLKKAYEEASTFYKDALKSGNTEDAKKYEDVLKTIKSKIVNSESGTLNDDGTINFIDDNDLALKTAQNDASLSSAVTELVSSRKDASVKDIATYRMNAGKNDKDYDYTTADSVKELSRIKENYSEVLSKYVKDSKGSLSTTDYRDLNKYRKDVQSATQELKSQIDDLQVEIDKIEQSNVKSAANANRDAAHITEGGLKGGSSRFGSEWNSPPPPPGGGPGGPPPGPGGPPPGPGPRP